ncbi:hypothetical protein HanPSC8_Chr03g0096921 [Helianthus annuus]|nr:hypothetical protein HanPSC8_Chr03g0096921 [Helianthus annuus]
MQGCQVAEIYHQKSSISFIHHHWTSDTTVWGIAMKKDWNAKHGSKQAFLCFMCK